MLGKKKIPVVASYTSNPVLKTIAQDWAGTPLDQNGLFINPEFPTILSFRKINKSLWRSMKLICRQNYVFLN